MPYTVNPFDDRFLSQTPWDPEYTGTPWQRVMSYASLIFVLVHDKWPEYDTAAREWAEAFKTTFRGPYVNVVLPLFDTSQTDLVHKLVGHLAKIHGKIKSADNVATVAEEQKVRLGDPERLQPYSLLVPQNLYPAALGKELV